jgi:hypothetical protein
MTIYETGHCTLMYEIPGPKDHIAIYGTAHYIIVYFKK